MTQPLPPGQPPIDPQGAFRPVPPPPGMAGGLPPMPPPPLWLPPPPPPPSRGRSWAGLIFGTLATLIFTGSLLLNLIWLISAAMSSDEVQIREHTLVSGNPLQKVAVVPVNGIILGRLAEKFDRLLDHVERETGVKALVVEVDTPGGDVSASDEMYQRLLQFKADKPGVPVVVAMKGLATSGGYYLSCAADYLYAEPTTLTANIGVLMPRYNLKELADKWGVKDNTMKSTGSPYKDAGSMFKDENPQELAYWQGIIDNMYAQFTSVVRKGRGAQIKAKNQTVEALADGRALTAQEALAKGIVDQIGYPQDAYKYAATTAGFPTGASVVRYEEKSSFGSFLTGESKFAGSAKTVNGLNINLDQDLANELLRPHVMYLWTGN